MEELPAERAVRDAVDRVADDRAGRSPPRWTRIWCIRPVSSRTRRSAWPAQSRSTSKCVTASRGVSVSSETRVGSSRSRPIGASIRPRAGARPRRGRARGRSRSSPRRADELREALVRLLRAGDDQQPRGVAVEPVDDPRALRLAAARRCPRARRRACRRACPAPAWTTSPAGLSTTARCSSCQTIARRGGGSARRRPPARREQDALPALEPVALRPRRGRRRERRPRPRARRRRGEPTCVARKRSSRSPAASGGTVSSRRQRAATSRCRVGGAARGRRRSARASRIATPMTMKLSARLNAGHQPKSMKSVT